tara:strand:+ start:2885 stop:6172 length:3288 start_codon:yes stop_codon:yes gene_type:complete
MTFQFKKADPLDLAAYQQRTEPGDGFVDSFNKAKRAFELNDTSISEANALEEVWQPIIDEMNSRETGETFYNPAINYATSIFNEEQQEQSYSAALGVIMDAINNNDAFSDLRGAVDRQMIFEQAAELARDSRQEYLKSVQNISTTRGTIGSFAGAAAASLDDPVLIGSMLFGGAKGLWQMAFQEAALGAGSEALVQTKVKEWYASTGQDYTDEQFWNAVKFGAAAGFATPFAFRGAGKTIQVGGKVVDLTVDQLKSGIAALRAVGVPRSSEARVLEELADDVQALDDANPLRSEPTFDIAASHEHKTRVEAASVAVERNQAPLIPDEPKVAPRAPESVYGPDNLDGTVFRFDPDELQVDAELFQFKSGGDEFGVTDRLQGITTWDPVKAGQVTVFEFADGRRFIADGHQRMGLAKRIKASDPSQDVRLYGHLLREVDDYTTADARVIAAVKNIAEGTGTALDAAKILKDAPERIGELPPRSRLVQQAQGLVLLSNKAFGAIINDVIPANYGAIIGRLIPEDEGMQDAAIAVLAKTQPANEFQAESIVRQVIDAGAETRTQESLFGEEVITESYFAERAKVLDQAVKQLRKDKASFANLVKNQKRLEAEGNKLAQSANKRRADNDSQAIGLLQALANIKGPLSDGLTAAARTARETGSYGQATDGFLEDVRRAIQEGDFDRLAAGDAGRIVNDTPQSSPRPAEPEPDVSLFDEPDGVGAQRQADQLEADVDSQIAAETEQNIYLRDEGNPEAFIEYELQLQQSQNFKSLDDLMERGAKNHELLQQAIREAATESGARPKDKVGVKGRERVAEKVRDKYAGDLNRIVDVARGGVDAPTPSSANDFVNKLAQKFKILDEGWSVTPEGYFDRKLTVVMPDGQLSEVQIWAPGLLEAKEAGGGHRLYEIYRNKNTPEAEKQKAFDDMVALYQKVADKLPSEWQIIVGRQEDAGIVPPSRATKDDISSIETSGEPSSLKTSLEDIGLQEPSAPRMTIEPSSSSMAGMDLSTRKNRIEASKTNIDIAVQDVNPPRSFQDILDETAKDLERRVLEIEDANRIPIGSTVDDAGNQIAETMTRKEMLDEIKQDKTMLDRLRDCVK